MMEMGISRVGGGIGGDFAVDILVGVGTEVETILTTATSAGIFAAEVVVSIQQRSVNGICCSSRYRPAIKSSGAAIMAAASSRTQLCLNGGDQLALIARVDR